MDRLAQTVTLSPQIITNSFNTPTHYFINSTNSQPSCLLTVVAFIYLSAYLVHNIKNPNTTHLRTDCQISENTGRAIVKLVTQDGIHRRREVLRGRTSSRGWVDTLSVQGHLLVYVALTNEG